MLIDAHIHAYTESLAAKVVGKLTGIANCNAYTDGTINGARELLKKRGADYGVLLPVATKPTQQTTINNWAKEVMGGSIISFGTVHPLAEDAVDETERIKELGLKGVKFHNDYQGVFIFDEHYAAIYKRCEELGLPVVFHMGYDPVSPYIHRAMPYDLIELTEKYPKLKIIGAHLGGMYAWESVYKYVAGLKNVYLDTAYIGPYVSDELFAAIVKKHGIDRILFGSDLPWSDPDDEKALIQRLNVPDSEKEKIYWKNTAELLDLNL